MPPLHYGDISGSLTRFWFLTGVAVAIGIIVYALCAYPSLRRPAFRRWRSLRLLGLASGVGITAVILCLLYLSSWTRFYRIDIEPDSLLLRYFLPERTARLVRSDIRSVERGIAYGSEAPVSMVIRTTRGRTYRSAGVSGRTYDESLAVLKAAGFVP